MGMFKKIKEKFTQWMACPVKEQPVAVEEVKEAPPIRWRQPVAILLEIVQNTPERVVVECENEYRFSMCVQIGSYLLTLRTRPSRCSWDYSGEDSEGVSFEYYEAEVLHYAVSRLLDDRKKKEQEQKRANAYAKLLEERE